MKLVFVKASGAGNDFVIIDHRRNAIPDDRSALARTLCHRHLGIGADGILYIEPSSRAQFRMNYYNADGTTGAMCGNGGRCAARYAALTGLAPAKMKFEAVDHIYDAEVNDEGVRLRVKNPSQFRPVKDLSVLDRKLNGYFINTGTPHFVSPVDDLKSLDVEGLGRAIRHHREFSPDGTNANFILVTPSGLEQRTYERGVEAETLACGTGSVASAIVSAMTEGLSSPVSVKVRSGEVLRVYFDRTSAGFENVWLEGNAQMIFQGLAEVNNSLDSLNVVIS